jgi:hypothetical protein
VVCCFTNVCFSVEFSNLMKFFAPLSVFPLLGSPPLGRPSLAVYADVTPPEPGLESVFIVHLLSINW